MRRREFITLLGGVAAAWPLTARAQQPAMSVIGLLTATNLNFDQIQAIQKGLNEGGYFEGRNLAIIYRSADGQFDRLPMLAADLVGSKASVILAVGGAGSSACGQSIHEHNSNRICVRRRSGQ